MSILAIKLPDVGEGVTEAELVEWHVALGDNVREDEIVAAVMTDKATVEIPSLYDGKIVELSGQVGDVVPIGSDLVRIETDTDSNTDGGAHHPQPSGKDTAAPRSEPKPLAVVPAAPPAADTDPIALHPERQDPAPALASPAVRKRVREAGLDLQKIPGSGPAGRITNADVDAFIGPEQAGADAVCRKRRGHEEIKVVGLRRKIAERMSLANARIPHITVVEEVDVTGVEALRAQMNATRGDKAKLTLLPILSAALSRALVDHPEINAQFDDEAGVITRYRPVHIGIATMTAAGLTVPVLKHAESLSLFDTASKIAHLAETARDGSIHRDDLSGSTITITSLGPLGALATTPIINHPEVAILGVNKIATRPHWDGQQFVPRQMMNISASFDHRVVDGWDAATFVQRIKTLLETPALIFVED